MNDDTKPRPLTQADIDRYKREHPNGTRTNRMGAEFKKVRKPAKPRAQKPKRGIAIVKGRPPPKLPNVSAPGTPLHRRIKETSAEIRRRRLERIRNK